MWLKANFLRAKAKFHTVSSLFGMFRTALRPALSRILGKVQKNKKQNKFPQEPKGQKNGPNLIRTAELLISFDLF